VGKSRNKGEEALSLWKLFCFFGIRSCNFTEQ